MRREPLPSNRADDPLQDAADLFQDVQLAAQDYEQHQGHSTDLLHRALARLFEFGETLRLQKTEPDRSLIQDFVRSKGLPWNAVTRRNPYNALVKLAFSQSASSHSQYAAVLSFASDTLVAPDALNRWLQDGGIKGRYAEATVHFGSARKQRNSLERASRLRAAEELLAGRKHSRPIALPSGVSPPEGFALLLAKVDSTGKAAIIDVVETDKAALEPVLLGYAPANKTGKSLLSAEPLGRLYRAVDLILGCTDAKPDGHDRHLLLINSWDRDRPVCRVEAISEAYTYAWAGMRLSGHLDDLPADKPFILTCEDAAFFRSNFSNHTGWAIRARQNPRIEAPGLASPIKLALFEPTTRYRVSEPPSLPEKPFNSTHADQLAVQQFLRERRAEHERHKAKSKERLSFPSTLKIHARGGRLELSLPKRPNLVSIFGSSSPDRDLSHRAFDRDDVERALAALAPYETDIDGSFVDFEVADAALCFRAHFDDDVLTVVLPTKAGTAYNQSCIDLELLVRD